MVDYDGFCLCRFAILGEGFAPARFWMPLTWGTGVGALDPSSSVFTPDGRLRLFDAGDVLALGPLDPVPCWLAWSCIGGACI